MRKDVFIETRNVMDFRQKIATLESDSGEPGFALIFGQAGRGKTDTTRNYYARNGGVFLRVMQGWTQTAFLQELCFQVCSMRPRSAAACKAKVIEAIEDMPQTIFVDEADRLHVDRIEDLRDIFDVTGSPVVLIGEQELRGVLGTRRRIWSRVKQVVEFGPVTEEDVAILGDEAAGLDIEPEAAASIVRQSDGDFRLVWSFIGQLEQVARTHETSIITVGMVGRVAKHVASWRK
ncbi:AAA family ATPase [Oleidesulfovibrio sp.]|uniref:AAA family ATPase n=1 Tax=Oleidesulfovibrio sp. TaxID=2909707 RepID=UPI003A83845D